MHILLTDILSCPRCGPDFALILLGDRIEDRRVLEGRLGCANCREQYVVRGGYADLRAPGSGSGSQGHGDAGWRAGPRVREEEVVRLGAMLGVVEGGGFVLVAGPEARLGAALARMVEGLEVVVVGVGPEGEQRPGVNRLGVAGRLPFYDRSLRAVALSGEWAESWEPEAARVVKPGGRLVLDPAASGAAERLDSAGFHVVVREGDTLVLERG